MERLTKYGKTSHENGVCCTHFNGKECHEVNGNCAYGCKWEEEAWRKLARYEELEEEGMLIELPCNVGDTIYRINQYAKEPIISMKVLQIRFGELCIGNSFLRIDAINDEDMGEFCYFKENIGKTVFLTREEAEAALERINNEI